MSKKVKRENRVFLFGVIFILAGAVTAAVLSLFNPKTEVGDISEPEPVVVKKTSDEKALEKLSGMTLDEKIGQLLFARVPEANIIEDLNEYHLGGYILFGRDVEGESLDSLAAKISSWQSMAKIPMFMGIDEEGGIVSRLSYAGLADFSSPQDLYAEGGFGLIRKEENEKIDMLEKLGINVNFAPVADTCTNENSFIYERTFGKDAAETAEFISNIAEVYNGRKVSATLKHFPGYGNNADTHTGIAVDDRTLEDFRAADFLPFKAGVEKDVDFIMFSHNIVTNVDPFNPASISPEMHRILRDELNYSGLAITDDLSMDAVAEYYHGEYPSEVQAILAGNNMMIVSDYKTAFTNLKLALESGIITEEKLNELLLPVLKLKAEKGLFD